MNYEKFVQDIVSSGKVESLTDMEALARVAFAMGEQSAMMRSLEEVQKLVESYQHMITYFSPTPTTPTPTD